MAESAHLLNSPLRLLRWFNAGTASTNRKTKGMMAMTNYIINKDLDQTLKITGSDNSWFINSDVALKVTGTAIEGQVTDDRNNLVIYGDVANQGPFAAISIKGDSDFVHVATSSMVISKNGAAISFGNGIDNALLNEGMISGKRFGFIGGLEEVAIENVGQIRSAGTAVKAQHGLELDNSGLIQTKGGTAILGGDGVETIHNHGRIVGDVKLGGGTDWFFFENGTVEGRVFGGDGDDIYTIGKKGGAIVETVFGGSDLIYSSKSYTLGVNLERLVLQGSEDLNAFGNALDNLVWGNAGDNVLRGARGADQISGGSGHDILWGGAGADRFEMDTATGRDRVVDFAVKGPNHDIVDLSDQYMSSLPTDFSDVQDHMTQRGNDVWIEYASNEQMVLKNVQLDELYADHFIMGF